MRPDSSFSRPHFFRRTVNYRGTNSRIEALLRRARAGEPISVAVLGGSVTSGHGTPWIAHHLTWSQIFANDVWNATFPQANFTLGGGGFPAVGQSSPLARSFGRYNRLIGFLLLVLDLRRSVLRTVRLGAPPGIARPHHSRARNQ